MSRKKKEKKKSATWYTNYIIVVESANKTIKKRKCYSGLDTYEANLSHGCAGNGGPIRRAKDIRYYTITMTVRVIASKKHGIAAHTPSILK